MRLSLSLLLLFLLAAGHVLAEQPVLFQVEDVFTIPGRGTVVVGKMHRGTLRTDQQVELLGYGPSQRVTVTAIESNRKAVSEAAAGESPGLVLRGVDKAQVRRGQVLATPGSLAACTRFRARLEMLTPEAGGRRIPFASGYRPQVQLWGADVTATVTLPSGRESVAPGDTQVLVDVELADPVAIEKGQSFAIREGGRAVGSGIVVEPAK